MKTGFFEEKPQVKSSTRLMTFIAAMGGIFIAVYSVVSRDITLGDSLPMVITLLGYSFGAKVFQKALENGK